MEADHQKQSDNVEAALDVILKHGVYIRQIIRGLVRDDADVEDLFQDFFLRLAAKPIPPHIRNVRAFLRTLLLREALDAQRRARRYAAHVKKCGGYFRKTINNVDPADAIIEEEQLDALLGAFEHYVQGREYRAVRLRYRESKNNAEIAEIMGVKASSVARYICTGLEKMRKIMEGRMQKGREQ